jgi:hypothetical protein
VPNKAKLATSRISAAGAGLSMLPVSPSVAAAFEGPHIMCRGIYSSGDDDAFARAWDVIKAPHF